MGFVSDFMEILLDFYWIVWTFYWISVDSIAPWNSHLRLQGSHGSLRQVSFLHAYLHNMNIIGHMQIAHLRIYPWNKTKYITSVIKPEPLTIDP